MRSDQKSKRVMPDAGTGANAKTPDKLSSLGVLEWFHTGDYEHVDFTLDRLKDLGIQHLRTGISWADYYSVEGQRWLDWLLPRLAREVEVLPCFTYTPADLTKEGKTSAPPIHPKAFADFLDIFVNKHSKHIEWVELWNEPNNRSEYDYTLDKHWHKFTEMIGGAAYWMKHLGKKTLLGGMSPVDPNWLEMIAQRDVLKHFDAVGIHGFPYVFEVHWPGWNYLLGQVQDVLDQYNNKCDLWITEAGFSTWQHDERKQLDVFLETMKAPAERIYWYALKDLDPKYPTVDGYHLDEREYNFGLTSKNGQSKLLYKVLKNSNSMKELFDNSWMANSYSTPILNKKNKNVLITGGAGFVGTNLASRLLNEGYQVTIFDNVSRDGVEKNLQWMKETYKSNLRVEIGDIRNGLILNDLVADADVVYHFSAQVAVTTSCQNPREDFDINLVGTMNLLDALRGLDNPPPLIFTSTNKVYGGLEDVHLKLEDNRYEPVNDEFRIHGIPEARKIDFHSPYGCSKGAADQYILDHARTMGLKTAVFRMSCIYGPHQYGNEDQGWVAHFAIQALEGNPITIYGDGKQVRDALFVEDLVNAFLAAWNNIDKISGQAFNIGGGPENSISLIQLIKMLEELNGSKIELRHGHWRPGDQRWYVSDTRKFQEATGWQPKVPFEEGIERLYKWLSENAVNKEVSSITAAAE